MSYRDEYYTNVDSLFEKLKGDPFKEPISDPTEYEVNRPGSIQPAGWVKNADGTDGTATVIIDADGILIIDGRIEVRNSGGTVIIDGSSEMFKIAASGQINTGAISANSSATVTVTLTGLGALAATPGFQSYIGSSNVETTSRTASWFSFTDQGRYAALTSGGAVTTRIAASEVKVYTMNGLDGAFIPVVSIVGYNGGLSPATYYARYYVLEESAI